MRAELQQLWKIERPQITQAVQDAAKNGDRSENADYIYGKRRLREIDRRVRYLTRRLDTITIVEDKPRDKNKVFFAAWVTVEDDHGISCTYRIVGADEIDPRRNWISMDSPMARALLGKKLDDEVEVSSPKGKLQLVITAINYDGP